MAQLPLNGPQQATDSSKSMETMANWAGAAISFALVIGAGVWGYNLLVRDVTGVPVVRAIEGPMREQPLDPGGAQAAHQGLAVNNVAAEGTAEAPADRLVLAPPPISLADEDSPVTLTSLDPDAMERFREQPQEQVVETPAPITAPDQIDLSNVDDLANQLIGDTAALGEVAAAPETPVAQPETPKLVSKVGLDRSVRPKLRPEGLKQSVQLASAAANEQTAAAVKPIDASSIPPGTRLVQLGAFASDAIARDEWTKLQAKFGDYLGDKQLVIQKAESGGRTFYRLRAQGFADLSDARRLCSALKAENADCIPVVTR